jgi:hypothetical protein
MRYRKIGLLQGRTYGIVWRDEVSDSISVQDPAHYTQFEQIEADNHILGSSLPLS